MKGLTTCLWFNNQAEAAAAFYASILQKLDLETLRHAYKGEPMSRREGSPVRV